MGKGSKVLSIKGKKVGVEVHKHKQNMHIIHSLYVFILNKGRKGASFEGKRVGVEVNKQ
jgi:hypothetical protein